MLGGILQGVRMYVDINKMYGYRRYGHGYSKHIDTDVRSRPGLDIDVDIDIDKDSYGEYT